MHENQTIQSYQLLTLDNDAFTTYVFWTAVLLFKLILMSFLTAIQRIRKKAPISPEDLSIAPKGAEIKVDEDVERVRRAHLNDLENIPAFILFGFFYVLTDPNTTLACWFFRIGTVSRILHTVVYCVIPIRQPARAICFFIPVFIMIYMSIMIMIHFFHVSM